MKYIHSYKLFEKRVDMILYHGGLEGRYEELIFRKFKKFKPKTAYFSDNPKFAIDYADMKSFDRGLDADRILYTCKFKGNLFDASNSQDLKKLDEKLPNKIKIKHPVAWFLDAYINKEDLLRGLKGFVTIYPEEKYIKANIGDIISRNTGKNYVLNKDKQFIYIIDEYNLSNFIDASSKGYVEGGITYYDTFKDIFENWRKEVLRICNVDKESEKKWFYSMLTHLMKKDKIDKYDKISLNITEEQFEYLKKIWSNNVEQLKKDILNTNYINKVSIIPYEKSIKETKYGNFNLYEDEEGLIHKAIEELGFDGYIAYEGGNNTYAIFHPDKTIEIIDIEIS